MGFRTYRVQVEYQISRDELAKRSREVATTR
jgi:hypothetical protein